jgi:hypothetical protein
VDSRNRNNNQFVSLKAIEFMKRIFMWHVMPESFCDIGCFLLLGW